MVLDGKRFGTFVVAVGTVLLSLALWASPAWAQAEPPIKEGESPNGVVTAQQTVESSGPLAGETVTAIDSDDSGFVDVLTIGVADCVVSEEGATITIEDEDGTQGLLVDDRDNPSNVDIRAEPDRITIRGIPPGSDIQAFFVNGGDGELASGPYTVVTSTGIRCQTPPPDEEPPPGEEPPPSEELPPGEEPPGETPLPQDEDKGPLAGGTAIGRDTNGDLLETLPDGTQVFGIDIVEIAAENCEVTDPDNLTVTLDNQGVPGRFINGENADITVDESGVTITGGTGPNELLEPLLVEQDDAGVDLPPNDTFMVVSTTGIGGEGCRPVGDSAETDPNNGAGDDQYDEDDVIEGSIPDTDLPETGGFPPLLAVGFFLVAGAGLGTALLRRRF